MANERITENIVRTHLHNDDLFKNNQLIIEEQSSQNPKINKLLKNASKSGKGKGYPEFIIQFNQNSNLIMVVECKADISKHESKNKNQYKDYAVDGVLLYASFLAKEHDVIAIAVSGDKNNKRISHFLQLKGMKEAHSIFNDDKLLTLKDYLNGYQTDERKFNQDFQGLLRYSKSLNDKLHSLKVKESERSLLISGTLIALADQAFINSYKHESPKALANLLVTKINEKLSSVQTQHVQDIISSYNFIKTHTILATGQGKLKGTIDEIDEKINNFIKTYKYFDTLGQFYIEFLKYANNDKGLGIVLTPPHITELFCEVANINKDSVVLDTCTGTGGFLISAMQKMIIDAGGDKAKEKKIKAKQIVGVELQHDIYSLLCSNMYIHGDGRSNLMKGSCFDSDIKNQVAKFKPNVGFLNPPYKTNKDDVEELQFVLNNLSLLEKGSYCVAIIPISCAISSNNKKNNDLKERLLKEHTLEAVFSMPTELFHNSKVGVNTCIMVLKAKEKHPKNYKTYFGYWREDGFTKRKNTGRTDYKHTWSKTKQVWLDNYRNKEEIVGHSIKRVVTVLDEWCVEAYMETNYSKLTNNDFKETLRKFLVNEFANDLINNISEKSISNSDMKLNQERWKYFNLIDFFDMFAGKYYPKDSFSSGKVPLVSASDTTNGVMSWTDLEPKFAKKSITIGKIGATTYYQSVDFVASPDVTVLKPKFCMNNFIGLFLTTVINQENIKWFYGRQIRLGDCQKLRIKFPVDKNGKPNWQFMENYIKSLPYSSNL